MARTRDLPIIPCRLEPEVLRRVEAYCEALKQSAPFIGKHGLSEEEFWEMGLFFSAVEKLRGGRAASTATKKSFIRNVLDNMKERGLILSWRSAETADRHDFEVQAAPDWTCVIEAKGCLDGNNTNIFERPPNADEFIIWSLCQNPAADPRKNVWSGIHTRLSAEIIHRKQVVDGVVVWDSLCGGLGRPCPKLAQEPDAGSIVGKRRVPPPCIYVFPRTVPDPRNNKAPLGRGLEDLKFLRMLHKAFGGRDEDVTQVLIEAGIENATFTRRTILRRGDAIVHSSAFCKIRRAR